MALSCEFAKRPRRLRWSQGVEMKLSEIIDTRVLIVRYAG